MATPYPITVQRLANLAEVPFNLPTSAFRYNSLSLSSDQFVCVKDVAADGTNQVVVIDLHNDNAVTRRPTKKADAALMHTKDNIIVLRGKNEDGKGHFIQIFNLDTKTRLLEHHFSEDIVFWTWASVSTLSVITSSSVWHCYLEVGKSPEKICDRGGRLADSNVQIIDYSVDASAKWCLLAGISTQDKKKIDGHLQLYSVERQQQQFLEGHAGCFGNLVTDESKPAIAVFSFVERKDEQFKIHVMDVYSPRGENHPPPFKMSAEFSFPPEAPLDFPISEHLSAKHGVIYLVSRGGYIVILDAYTGTLLFRHHVSREAVFVSCGDTKKGGVIFVNRKGEIISAAVNEQSIIPYIQQNLRHIPSSNEIAMSLVRRYGYPGADEALLQSFNAAFARGDYKTAARIVATMKSGALRTSQTINQFKAATAQPGQTSPVLLYFSALLEHGQLNTTESLELVRPVVAQGRKEFVQKWLDEDKLECSEALGDVIKHLDAQLALRVYEKGNASQKVLQCYVEQGQYDKIIVFAKKTNLQADYALYLRNMINVNPEGAVNFAKGLLNNTPPLIDINQIVDVFVQQSRLQEITSILLDYLKENREDQGHLQTKLFELNLTHATQVAEAIFQMDLFTHYDRNRVAQFCEKAGLYQRALENYTDYTDIKRILPMQSGGQLNSDWLVNYFGKLPPDTCLECLTDMLRINRQNLQVVVQVAVKHHESLGTGRLIEMFETFQSWEGIFYFLGSILAFSTDPEVHFKYIEAASKLNHVQEVERVCRESSFYDPVRVKDFLKQSKLVDPRPLIYVCDRHDYVTELAEYLYKNSLMKFIEVYVVKVNPLQAPVVIGVLIDLDCSEDFIKSLLQSVRGACPVKELVEEVDKRNRLRLLLPWLEARVAEGNQELSLHNALAMIYIDTNRDPETFLKTNAFYDPKIVGKYCEERDPHLAYTAYYKNWGTCDFELVELTNKNGLFRLQARYLVERQSPELWAHVLDPNNQWRGQVVDQVVSSALPESTNAEEVSATVRAFIAANLPNELMELLEKVVLHNSDFSQNKNLQNLLILTAIKSDPSRVMDYINRLEHYDGPEIAQVALGEDYKMYEEAVLIYQKVGMEDAAMDVIIDRIGSLDRATEFAARRDQPSVWNKLGRAQLKKGLVAEAIDSFLKAEDASAYKSVIEEAQKQEKYPELIKYLTMARKALSVKDSVVDSELAFSLAKCHRLNEMSEFISGSNTANIQLVGDRLADCGNCSAAKVLYSSIPNYSKLATCHLYLNEYSQAVDVAKRANNPKTWKEVNIACVHAKDFKNAHVAGLAIIGHPDHLEELIVNYERLGYFEELILLLEAGSTNERAPIALFSELGVVYAKYKPEKLSGFICTSNVTSGRLNIPKLVRACERHLLWNEAVYLHITYKEYDQAATTMISHPTAWNHSEFLNTIKKVANSELYYRAVSFYLEISPMNLNEVLMAVSNKIDHGRVVQQLRKLGHLPLAQQYLEHVQSQQMDLAPINTALNELYLHNEDVENLRKSITENPNFDQLTLAQELLNHSLLQMRRLASLLYKNNNKFNEAIELLINDGQYHEAMEAAKNSRNPELAENLLKYFVYDIKDKECFTACLYICYELLKPDIVLELAWKTGFTDQIMPYMIQTFGEVTKRLDALEKKAGLKESDKEKSAPNDYVPDYMVSMAPALPGMGNLALMPPPGGINAGSTNAFGPAYSQGGGAGLSLENKMGYHTGLNGSKLFM